MKLAWTRVALVMVIVTMVMARSDATGYQGADSSDDVSPESEMTRQGDIAIEPPHETKETEIAIPLKRLLRNIFPPKIWRWRREKFPPPLPPLGWITQVPTFILPPTNPTSYSEGVPRSAETTRRSGLWNSLLSRIRGRREAKFNQPRITPATRSTKPPPTLLNAASTSAATTYRISPEAPETTGKPTTTAPLPPPPTTATTTTSATTTSATTTPRPTSATAPQPTTTTLQHTASTTTPQATTTSTTPPPTTSSARVATTLTTMMSSPQPTTATDPSAEVKRRWQQMLTARDVNETIIKEYFYDCSRSFEAGPEENVAAAFAESCSGAAENLTSILEPGETINVTANNIDVYNVVIPARNFTATGFRHELRGSSDDVIDAGHQEVVISPDITRELNLADNDSIGVSIVLYKRGEAFIDHAGDHPSSHVVSITVSLNGEAVSVPVGYALQHTQAKENVTFMEYPSCVFYDMESEVWSDNGCEVVSTTETFTRCKCNHTTHFGILLQVRPLEKIHTAALTLISYIGGGVSIGCLVITLIILNYLRSLNSVRVRIHKNLVSALILAHSVFLCTAIAGTTEISCRAATLLLHYFYLAVFCWSMMEGLNLYLQIIKVFSTGKQIKYWHYLLFGWGVPVPIVAVSAGVKWDIYGTDKICWLTVDQGLIWSFAGPVLCIIALNFLILIMVVRVIVTSAAAVRTESYAHVTAGVKGALLLLPILGVGWVFGLLSLGKGTVVFTYIFVIAVVSQGFLIFLLYCVFNSEVRAALTRKRETQRLRHGHDLHGNNTASSVPSRESNETSSSFASRLMEKIKRSKSLTGGRRQSSPVDAVKMSSRVGTQSDPGKADRQRTGSFDSGYGHAHGNHGDEGSLSSIRADQVGVEFLPPNTPSYE